MMPDHEAPSEIDFEEAYRTSPPWDVGHPQPAVVELAPAVTGPILDVGCGSGENALEFAKHGHEVVAVDSSGAAIRLAREKAADRGVDVEFVVADAHNLVTLGRRFATVVDSALFHVITARARYADELARVIEPDGTLVLLEISDAADIPYPKVSRSEIRSTFSPPDWIVETVSPSTFDTHLGTFPAWLAFVRRSGG